MGVYRDQHGRWRYRKRVRLYDGTFTRVKGSPALNTKAAAEQAERAHIERTLRGALGLEAKKEVLTFARFVGEIWWPKYRTGGGTRGINSPTTLMEKEMHLRVHLVPKLGHVNLTQITNERVMELFGLLRGAGYQKKGTAVRSQQPKAVQKRKERAVGRKDRGKPRKGLGEKSIKNLRTTLHTILVYAVKWGYLDRLPELPEVRVPESSFDWYQPSEAVRLIEGAANGWERAVLMFPLHTGVRMGEQRAIRWSDVDFALHRIHIRQSAPKWLDEEKAPKSNRQRWVDLTPELATALQSIRHGKELVFCNDDGRKLAPGQFHEILWAAQRRAGLRRIKWHELRHSFASILASGGMPLFILRALLGHSSVKMTERYAHLAAGQSAAFSHLLSAAAPTIASTNETPVSGPQAGPRTLPQPN